MEAHYSKETGTNLTRIISAQLQALSSFRHEQFDTPKGRLAPLRGSRTDSYHYLCFRHIAGQECESCLKRGYQKELGGCGHCGRPETNTPDEQTPQDEHNSTVQIQVSLPMPNLSRNRATRGPSVPGAVAVGTSGPEPDQDGVDEERGISEVVPDGTNAASSTVQNEENLFEATLVEDEEPRNNDDALLVEAHPALEGFHAIVKNERFKYVACCFCVIVLALVIPLAVLLPRSSSSVDVEAAYLCGSLSIRQTDYIGDISVTESGRTCQVSYCMRWKQESVTRSPSHALLFVSGPLQRCMYFVDEASSIMFCPLYTRPSDSKLCRGFKCSTFSQLLQRA